MPNPTTDSHIPSGAKGHEYEQSIRTPEFILARVREHAPIDLDPFTDRGNMLHTGASHVFTWPGDDALQLPWTRPGLQGSLHVCANPPFNALPAVLEHIAEQRFSCVQSELTALLPIRSHRRYWRFTHGASAVVELPAFAFAGHDHTFPLPCGLFYWGARPTEWARVMSAIGTVTRTQPLGDDQSLTNDPSRIIMRAVPKKHMHEWLRDRAVEVVRQAAADGLSVGDIMGIGGDHSLDALVIEALRNSPVLDGCVPSVKPATSRAQTKAVRKAHPVSDPRETPVVGTPEPGTPRARYSAYLEGIAEGAEVLFEEVHKQVGAGVTAPTVRRWLLAEKNLERLTPARPMRFRKGGERGEA